MSNIFLATAFIYLASEQAGCLDEEGEVLDSCDERVHGQSPTALIANIAVFSGLLSAFFMPFAGAAVDYTPYRRRIGAAVAALMMCIQAAQIATISSTWFAMAILQAINGFLYQVQILSSYAYLPEICLDVGESTMVQFNAAFTMVQFGAQALFLLVVTAFGLGFDFDDVQTGHLGQAVNTVWSGFFFAISWWMMPSVPASHELPQGRTLLTQSFVQVWDTSKHIWRNYAHSLRWFFLALVFAESAVNAFTTLSVVFLDEQIGMSGSEIGVFFIIALLGTLPGSAAGAWITHRSNPNISWRLSMLTTVVVAIVGAFLLDEDRKAISYVWGLCIGICLGWFYPVENTFFSMLLPKGQEAELAGFYVYSTQVLGWLPPLIFSILVEQDVNQKFGILALQGFFVIAILILSLIPSWKQAVVEAHSLDALAVVENEEEHDLELRVKESTADPPLEEAGGAFESGGVLPEDSQVTEDAGLPSNEATGVSGTVSEPSVVEAGS
jgi:UMF1 family MFS transporter